MIPVSATAASFHGQRCPVDMTAVRVAEFTVVIEWLQRLQDNVTVSRFLQYTTRIYSSARINIMQRPLKIYVVATDTHVAHVPTSKSLKIKKSPLLIGLSN